MSYSEDEVKNLAELREWFYKQINEKEDEVQRLKMALMIIDNTLKQASFKPAVMIGQRIDKESEYSDERQLKSKDDVILANVYTVSNSITIIPISDMKFNVNTPPFQSFFINRILEGMKSKDKEYVERREIELSKTINYNVDGENGLIKKIVINNYRDMERLNEIINTASWVFSRMLEKTR